MLSDLDFDKLGDLTSSAWLRHDPCNTEVLDTLNVTTHLSHHNLFVDILDWAFSHPHQGWISINSGWTDKVTLLWAPRVFKSAHPKTLQDNGEVMVIDGFDDDA